MLAAVRKASAARVIVGLTQLEVGNTAEPAMNRILWSYERHSVSTTDDPGSLPMRQVPMMWPEPEYVPVFKSLNSHSSSLAPIFVNISLMIFWTYSIPLRV